MAKWYCRQAPSLGGGFEGTPQSAWGTPKYIYRLHKNNNAVFFGLYDLRDYIALWRHKGKAAILWAGADIRNLRANFIFNDGKLQWLSIFFDSLGINFRDFIIKRIISKADSWVENEAEAWQLKDMKVKVTGICPSFMGNIKDYKVSFKPGNKIYLSASKGREQEYGWGLVTRIAPLIPWVEFHLYGSKWEEARWFEKVQGVSWNQVYPNVFLHGRVPQKKMNKEIKQMQGSLRPNKHDGFSEITAKSVLWGQYPITYLYYPEIDQFATDNYGIPDTSANIQELILLLDSIHSKKSANLKARKYYLKNINKYPWVQK